MTISSHPPLEPSSTTTSHPALYEQDFYLWIEKAAGLLREGNLDELDLENLIEEIECMGRSEKRSISSNLEVILMHLLKYKYQPDKRSNSWRFTIIEHRRRILKELRESPSLKKYFLDIFADEYDGSRKLAAAETGLNTEHFPIHAPFTPDQVLDEDFLPEE
jgi:hypothetical protein